MIIKKFNMILKGTTTMKKLLAFALTLLVVMSMSLGVFAAPGKFINSPTANNAPVVIEIKPLSPDCTGEIIVTPYSQRYTLPEEERKAIEAAYAEIVAAIDLTKFCDIFAAHVHKQKIDPEDLAVSDLFDVRVVNCTHHEPHEGFIITVKLDTLTNFAGLLHCHNGDWEMVENATVDQAAKTLTFQVDELSPFAVVVDVSNPAPDAGDATNIILWGGVAVVSAAALTVVVLMLRKAKKAEEQ